LPKPPGWIRWRDWNGDGRGGKGWDVKEGRGEIQRTVRERVWG